LRAYSVEKSESKKYGMKHARSLREMEPKVTSCNSSQAQTTTAATETSMHQMCHDSQQQSTFKTNIDAVDSDADQYSDVFTAKGTQPAATHVRCSPRQLATTSVTSTENEEEEEERNESMWETNTDDSTTICGLSMNNDDDDAEITSAAVVDERATTSHQRAHSYSVG